MKKTWIYLACASVFASSVLTSCDITSSRNYLGTMAGAEIGGVVGEALGWMSTDRHDGPGKAMLGSLIGTVAGAAIGNSLSRDKQEQSNYYTYDEPRNNHHYNDDNVGYQTGGGYDSTPNRNQGGYGQGGYSQNYNGQGLNGQGSYGQFVPCTLQISGINYQDEDGDGKFGRNETVNIIYDVKNTGRSACNDVTLKVEAVNNAKCFAFSPSTTVSIGPGESVRYKAKAFCKSRPSESVTQFKVIASSQNAGETFAELQIRMSK